MSKMIIEYKYYPTEEITEEIKRKLKVHFDIEYIKFCIEFNISTFYPATRRHEAEGNELNVISQEIIYCTTKQGLEIPVMLSKDQKFIIGDLIDYNILDKACYEAWENNEEDNSYLYD